MEVLFKPWKQQYQAYTQNANEALKRYNASLEYKYEVSLDLENFFPTIDPMLVYRLIVEKLPVNMECSDTELMKRILIKLLFCKLKTKHIYIKSNLLLPAAGRSSLTYDTLWGQNAAYAVIKQSFTPVCRLPYLLQTNIHSSSSHYVCQ